MVLTPREAERLAAAQVATQRQVRRRVLRTLLVLWAGLQGWRDADADAFVAAAAPVVEAGQRQTAAVAVAWLARFLQEAGLDVPDVDFDAVTDRRGVPKAEVYRRPFVTVRNAIAVTGVVETAVEQGRRRLESIAATDLQMAKVATSRQVLERSDDRVVGWRRVLVGSQSCGLCVTAASQRYHKEDLMPIHPGCDCNVAPIIGDADPGRVVAGQTEDGQSINLEDLHPAVQERFGVSSRDARTGLDYRDVLVTREHGEIGPVLARKGDKFTGPDDL